MDFFCKESILWSRDIYHLISIWILSEIFSNIVFQIFARSRESVTQKKRFSWLWLRKFLVKILVWRLVDLLNFSLEFRELSEFYNYVERLRIGTVFFSLYDSWLFFEGRCYLQVVCLNGINSHDSANKDLLSWNLCSIPSEILW